MAISGPLPTWLVISNEGRIGKALKYKPEPFRTCISRLKAWLESLVQISILNLLQGKHQLIKYGHHKKLRHGDCPKLISSSFSGRGGNVRRRRKFVRISRILRRMQNVFERAISNFRTISRFGPVPVRAEGVDQPGADRRLAGSSSGGNGLQLLRNKLPPRPSRGDGTLFEKKFGELTLFQSW